MPPLILASTSPYRRDLLARLGLEFEVLSGGVSETRLRGESPTDRALRLAQAKARSVAALRPGAVVIGADQVAVAGEEELLDKPGSAEHCRVQLHALSGRSARFHTGCALLEGSGRLVAHVDTTTVVFRPLQADEIERYVARERPYDCAGGFKAEALGISLFECIESQDPTALIGLPLIWLAGALRDAGFRVP